MSEKIQNIAEISSVQNPKVKQVVKLRSRRARDTSGLFLLEGTREITRAHACGIVMEQLFFCPDLGADPSTLALPETLPLFTCPKPVFEKMAYREHPEGLLAVATQPRHQLEALALSDTPLLLVATGIEKPTNLGAMLRTADGVGVDALLVCDPVTDLYNPNVLRASTGAIFSVPTVVTDTATTLAFLRAHGIQVVCTTPDTDTAYHQADLTRPTAVVMGSEKDGLPDGWLDAADSQIAIPMQGTADSLNVSVTSAIVLYEALRQRQA